MEEFSLTFRPHPLTCDFDTSNFEPQHLLSDNVGIKTYLGIERRSRKQVVIRTVPRALLNPSAASRLEHEASVLKKIRCSSIISPIYFKNDAEHVMVVYPRIPGKTLTDRLRSGALSLSDTLTIAQKLFIALREAHEHHVLHSDVKPSNLIVDREGLIRNVTLIDFGLSTSAALDPALRALHVGTVSYMSPEQAGLIKSSVDERADLYSAGVVLYEALSGSCPFTGATIGEVLRKQLNFFPEPLRARGIKVPRALDELIERLLQKDPRERYQTASGVLSDVEQIAAALSRGQSDPTIVIGKKDRRDVLTEPAFIGRESELKHLNGLWAEARVGRGGLSLVEAGSGGGKTRLLQELVRQNQAADVELFWGQGVDQTAQRPFQVLEGIAEQLIRTHNTDAKSLEPFLGEMKEQLTAAIEALPTLQGLSREALKLPDAPEDFGEIRNLQALTLLLEKLGRSERPALVVLDDCQWADEQSLKLLQAWQKRRENQKTTSNYVLIIAAFRTEEVRLGHPLRHLRSASRIKLSPFGDHEVEQLVESMAGSVPHEAVQAVVTLAEGSPFMASAILRGLVEAGSLVASSQGWQMEPVKFSELSSSRAAATFLVKRLELLSAPHLSLLTAGAVLGKSFPFDLAAKLAGQSTAEALSNISEARRRHIVWFFDRGTHYGFVHDKLREALLSRADIGLLRRLHLQAASLLVQSADDYFAVAFHYDAAGDSATALPYALSAAEKARAQHSLEIALQLYRIAERGAVAKQAGSEVLKTIYEGLGDVLLLKGDYHGAAYEFGKILTMVTDRIELARLEGKLGETSFKSGDVRAAAASLESALTHLGQRVPRTKLDWILATSWEVFLQALHTLFPFAFLGRKPKTAESENDFQTMRICSRMAYVYWFGRGKVPCLWAHLKEMNLAEKYPASPELAQAYSEHAPVMTMIPYFSRGIRYAKKGLAIRKELGDLWGQGQSLHFYGIVLYSASRYTECIEKCREAVRIMTRMGDKWEVNTANWHIAFCLYRLGLLKESVELSQETFREGIDIHDHQAAGISLSSWARASLGKVPQELVQEEIKRDVGDGHTRSELFLAEGVRLLAQGQPTEARETFERGLEIIKQFGLHQEYVVPPQIWLATALREEIMALSILPTPETRRKLEKQQRRAVRRALAMANKYPNNLPHAYREAGLMQAMRGRYRSSFRYLSKSIVSAEAQSASYELYQSLSARAQIGQELGWKTFKNDKMLSDSMFVQWREFLSDKKRGVASVQELSLVDRFDALLDAGCSLSRALTNESVFEAVREAVKKLLRTDDCLLFVVRGDEAELRDGVGKSYSKELLKNTISSRKTTVWTEGKLPSLSDSIVMQSVRSAICSPIFVRGEISACLYVGHYQVPALFGQEETRLAEFIAALAGIALENAEGFLQLRMVSESRNRTISKLRRAQKELVGRADELIRSNTDLQRFAYVASHDLKEPLRTVGSYLKLLERRYKSELGPDADEFIGFAVSGVNRMYTLIDALLSYSRLGCTTHTPEKINLTLLLREALGNLHAAVRSNHAEVEWDELPTLHVTKILIVQLFQNLIGNALKFKRGEPPRIEIRCEKRSADYLITLSDNGIGIEQPYLERIFDVFKRLHRVEEYPGAGVGLAICRRVAELHGGRIWVESQVGVGTKFFISLPSVLAQQPIEPWKVVEEPSDLLAESPPEAPQNHGVH